MPDYVIIEVDDIFIRATTRSPEGDRIRANRGPNFGSVLIETVYDDGPDAAEPWAPVLMFDAMGFNADRKGGNPNVVWTGRQLYLIDHGMLAPTWTFHFDGTTNGSLYGGSNIRTHAGFRAVRGREADFSLGQTWNQRVTPTFLQWLRSTIPAQWASPAELDALFDFLAARSAIARAQETEIRGEASS